MEESVKEKFRELDQPIMQLDGPISVILKDNVRPDKFEEFETAVKVRVHQPIELCA